MGSKEHKVIDKILLQNKSNERLYRTNSGKFYAGKLLTRYKCDDCKAIFNTKKGAHCPCCKSIKLRLVRIIENPRHVEGFPAGTPDIIGFESNRICEHFKHENNCSIHECSGCDFNKLIAIFKAIEVKTGKQKLSEKQKFFRKMIIELGGIYKEVRDEK